MAKKGKDADWDQFDAALQKNEPHLAARMAMPAPIPTAVPRQDEGGGQRILSLVPQREGITASAEDEAIPLVPTVAEVPQAVVDLANDDTLKAERPQGKRPRSSASPSTTTVSMRGKRVYADGHMDDRIHVCLPEELGERLRLHSQLIGRPITEVAARLLGEAIERYVPAIPADVLAALRALQREARKAAP